jgi:hypothetical protein
LLWTTWLDNAKLAIRDHKLSAGAGSFLGMDIVDWRPVSELSGGEMLAQLDVLHAEIGRLQTLRLRLLAAIDEVGHAQEIGATDGGEVTQGGRRAGHGRPAHPEG